MEKTVNKNYGFQKKLAATHGTFSSFADLANALGVKPKEQRPAKPVKCKKCGGEMVRAGSSNVWVCHNEVEREVERNGEKVTEKRTCNNYFIRKATA